MGLRGTAHTTCICFPNVSVGLKAPCPQLGGACASLLCCPSHRLTGGSLGTGVRHPATAGESKAPP